MASATSEVKGGSTMCATSRRRTTRAKVVAKAAMEKDATDTSHTAIVTGTAVAVHIDTIGDETLSPVAAMLMNPASSQRAIAMVTGHWCVMKTERLWSCAHAATHRPSGCCQVVITTLRTIAALGQPVHSENGSGC